MTANYVGMSVYLYIYRVEGLGTRGLGLPQGHKGIATGFWGVLEGSYTSKPPYAFLQTSFLASFKKHHIDGNSIKLASGKLMDLDKRLQHVSPNCPLSTAASTSGIDMVPQLQKEGDVQELIFQVTSKRIGGSRTKLSRLSVRGFCFYCIHLLALVFTLPLLGSPTWAVGGSPPCRWYLP